MRRCVGTPPRQIEDPQSPPCVNYWEGDNGGATARGVTRDEIRVVTQDSGQRLSDLLFAFFNKRFEFYGRKLVAIPAVRSYGVQRPEEQRALAQKVAEENQAFAAFGYTAFVEAGHYFRELARLGVVAINSTHSYETSEDQEKYSPFLWSYLPPLDQVLKNDVEFACNSLVGRLASHAGPEFVTQTRKFAIAVAREGEPDYRPLSDGLRRCGATVRVVELSPKRAGYVGPNDEDKIIATDLRASGYTTLLCVCADAENLSFLWSAREVGYFPEVVTTGMSGVTIQPTNPSGTAVLFGGHNDHYFGLDASGKDLRPADQPVVWAKREMDPSAEVSSRDRRDYGALLLLASGIQMAGPHLTPQSFEQGLMKARFPNPGAGGPPYWQAHVGFGPGDHAMSNDLNAFWWSADARKEIEPRNPHGFCYINRGQRWSLGGWPEGALPFFDRTHPCR